MQRKRLQRAETNRPDTHEVISDLRVAPPGLEPKATFGVNQDTPDPEPYFYSLNVRVCWPPILQVVEAHFPSVAIFSRRAFTCATISGSKSSGSQKGRISRSLGPGIGFGHRLAHSTASSIDRTCQTQ